jgi:hypothetical protein
MQREYVLVQADTIEEFNRRVNHHAGKRTKEVEAMLDDGLDVLDHDAYYFKPESKVYIHFITGTAHFFMVMGRQKSL